MSSRLSTPGQLWLYRTKPLDDELFSSWLVRLAWGNAVKLQTFCVFALRTKPNFWTIDVDKDPPETIRNILACGTATGLSHIASTTLRAYGDVLWTSGSETARMPWVMPIRKHGRRRIGYGLQYCRMCLANDEQPYFRRSWRLSFHVVCPKHGVFLHDSCAQCGAPIEFHTGDFGARLLSFDCPITLCGSCKNDFRREVKADLHAPIELIQFQQKLIALFSGELHHNLPGAMVYPHLFLTGLRYLVRLLSSRSRGERIRNFLLQEQAHLGLGVSSVRSGAQFEELRIGDRAHIMELSARLLKGWPNEFIRVCRLSKVSSSYMCQYKGKVMPYWLWKEVYWHLYDKDYAVSQLERQSAQRFLENQHGFASRNAVNNWLGAACVGSTFSRGHTKRWNPRGPRVKPNKI